ncbi:MAG TPA: ABC transporter ATP-binding protein [Phycisphaerae bacterium]
MAYIELVGVQKLYRKRDRSISALADLSVQIDAGEFVAVMGPSGSGKSTLLNLLGGLDASTAGQVRVGEAELQRMSERQLTQWRCRHVGFVFQRCHLLAVLTAAQNVEVPLLLFKLTARERRERVRLALSLVGLEERADHAPAQLSGGEEQRVAIARAIVTDPALLLADEPTGDLDAAASEEIMALFERLNREFRKTVVLVTHDSKAAAHAARTLQLVKGELLRDERGAPHTVER